MSIIKSLKSDDAYIALRTDLDLSDLMSDGFIEVKKSVLALLIEGIAWFYLGGNTTDKLLPVPSCANRIGPSSHLPNLPVPFFINAWRPQLFMELTVPRAPLFRRGRRGLFNGPNIHQRHSGSLV